MAGPGNARRRRSHSHGLFGIAIMSGQRHSTVFRGRTAIDEPNNIIQLAEFEASKHKDKTNWLSNCLKNKDGQPLPVLTNAILALQGDPTVSGCVARDEMFCGPILLKSIPGSAIKAE